MVIEFVAQVECPVCGGSSIDNFTVSMDQELIDPVEIHLRSCQTCHTIYHDPRMSQYSMAEYYTGGVYRSHPTRVITKERESRALERVSETVVLIDKFSDAPPKRCLDVGCSRGYLSRALYEKYGAEVIGYDIYCDPDAVIDVVTDKRNIVGKFDLITCIHVLEHLYDPMAELRWMKGLLNDGGMLMIEVPLSGGVTLPHPIILSTDSIRFMMDSIEARYVLMDVVANEIGIVFARFGGSNGFSITVR